MFDRRNLLKGFLSGVLLAPFRGKAEKVSGTPFHVESYLGELKTFTPLQTESIKLENGDQLSVKYNMEIDGPVTESTTYNGSPNLWSEKKNQEVDDSTFNPVLPPTPVRDELVSAINRRIADSLQIDFPMYPEDTSDPYVFTDWKVIVDQAGILIYAGPVAEDEPNLGDNVYSFSDPDKYDWFDVYDVELLIKV